MTACPNDSLIVSFAGGGCPAHERASLEAHLDGCDECRALVAILSRDASVVRRATDRTVLDTVSAEAEAATLEASRVALIRRGHATGDLVDGKYRVEERLGAGGMATVLAATHVGLGRAVALKFLDPALARDPAVVARFLREGRATARLESEHVARVLDVGFDEVAQVPFLVMERLAGADFAELLAARGTLPVSEIVRLVVPVCAALEEAHRQGIIHRDIKPSNLFLHRRADGAEVVKVLDFGISKVRESQSALTTEGAFVGSPRYMSPEQMVSARDVDEQTDVWALGVVLYEMVAGAPPWDAPTVHGLALQIAHGSPRPLREIDATIPLALERLVHACLEKDPARRPRGPGAVSRALAELGSTATPARSPSAAVTPAREGASPRSKRRAVVAVAIAALALVAGAAAFARTLARSLDASDPETRTEPSAALAEPLDKPPPAVVTTAAPPSAAVASVPAASVAAPADLDAAATPARLHSRRGARPPPVAASAAPTLDRRALDERK